MAARKKTARKASSTKKASTKKASRKKSARKKAARKKTTRARSKKRGARTSAPPSEESSTGRNEQFTPEEIVAALRKHDGVQVKAAEELGCHRNTVLGYLERYPELRAEIISIDESVTDIAEGGLVKAVRGEEPWAIRLRLRTKGRNRGYRFTDEPRERRPPERGDGGDGAPEAEGESGRSRISRSLAGLAKRL